MSDKIVSFEMPALNNGEVKVLAAMGAMYFAADIACDRDDAAMRQAARLLLRLAFAMSGGLSGQTKDELLQRAARVVKDMHMEGLH